jgi:hypothetical protein
VPGIERVQMLLNHMIEEDADRRAQQSAGYLGEQYRGGGHPTGGWGTGGFPTGGQAYVTDWGTREPRGATSRTDPVY